MSPRMIYIAKLIDAISKTSATVLLTGETGTGKELIARAIHQESPRAQKPFVAINCGAIPAELMERELFGHVKGAFSGAHQNSIGKLEYADGGSVFLDEIATLPLPLQVKLLRVLQEKTFEPVGSLIPRKIDVRFIAAANVNLLDEVQKGLFREDLYYRLNVVPIHLPPLRERREDIRILFEHFIDMYSGKYKKRITGISEKTIERLMAHSWPGNIRELQNISEMLVVLAEDGSSIDTDSLPDGISEGCGDEPASYVDALRSFEKEFICKILNETGWNRTEAAKKMGIHRNTLTGKMKGLGILKPAMG
ncbi:sigma-54 dependent transcriptional regulator [bacterium]|nr:sigma-54 dependent transcriptional regulator [bacterium]